MLGETSKQLRNLKIHIEVDGYSGFQNCYAMNVMDHDMILGNDFCIAWDVQIWSAKRLWRVHDGARPEFHRGLATRVEIETECAGITEPSDEEKKKIEELITKYVLDLNDETPGMTELIKHTIDVQEAAPINQPICRMSPKMLKVAQDEVKKLEPMRVIE